jgi:hypothetical protein
MAVRHVVERRVVAVLHGPRHIADQPPLADFIIGPQAVVGLPHVRTVAHRHEALQVERHLLPADARLDRAGPHLIDVRDERLFEIELILVDRADRVLAERPRVDELHERLQMAAIAQVRMDVRALDHVVVVAPRPARTAARCSARSARAGSRRATGRSTGRRRAARISASRTACAARTGSRAPTSLPASG